LLKYLCALVLAGTLLGTTAVAAEATIITTTWTGAIATGGVDHINMFGLGNNADLSGQTFTLITTFDTKTAVARLKTATFDYLTGGGSAILTINHHDVAFDGSNQNMFETDSNRSKQPSTLSQDITDQTADGNVVHVYVGSGMAGPLFSPSLTNPIPLMNLCPADYQCLGLFIVRALTSDDLATGRFDFTSGTVQVSVTATPIPPSLALFVSALSGLGRVGLYRRESASLRKSKLCDDPHSGSHLTRWRVG